MIFNVSSGAGRNALNYRVLAVMSAPTLAGRENDIAVVTSTPITDVAISSICTSAIIADVTGNVWIRSYLMSDGAFNAAKRGYLGVYPGECTQYDGTAWVSCDAYIYQSGAWKLLVKPDIDLYKDGILLGSDSTWYFGGQNLNYGSFVRGYGTYPNSFVFDADEFFIVAAQLGSGNTANQVMHKRIDFTGISKLRLQTRAYVFNGAANTSRRFLFGVSDTTWIAANYSQMIASRSIDTAISALTAFELDVSAITGEHYATIYLGGYKPSGGRSSSDSDYVYINEFVGVCA